MFSYWKYRENFNNTNELSKYFIKIIYFYKNFNEVEEKWRREFTLPKMKNPILIV